MVHGDPESKAKSRKIPIPTQAKSLLKSYSGMRAISTRPIGPLQKSRLHGLRAFLPVRAAVMLRAAAIMQERRQEIVDWLIRESGSTRFKAELEWRFVRSIILEAASFPHRVEGRILPLDEAGKESRAYRQPLGVIGVISPWNFPMHLSHRSIGPALALGNGVVVKPAEDTPVTGGLLIAKIYEEAGLPPGLLNIVIGEVKDIGDVFTLHPIPSLISFTGSTKVGRHIGRLAMSGPRMKRVALELGEMRPALSWMMPTSSMQYRRL